MRRGSPNFAPRRQLYTRRPFVSGYGVSPILVGALAAAEPLGAIATGISLSAGWLRLVGRLALLEIRDVDVKNSSG
jgi:hypothetical protein